MKNLAANTHTHTDRQIFLKLILRLHDDDDDDATTVKKTETEIGQIYLEKESGQALQSKNQIKQKVRQIEIHTRHDVQTRATFYA